MRGRGSLTATPLPPTPIPTTAPTAAPTDLPTLMDVIGKWEDELPPGGFGGTITIYRTNDAQILDWKFPDGSNVTHELE